MAIIFDGRAFAAKKLATLDKEVAKLKNRGIHPRLASILVGEATASKLYVSLKKKRANEIGIEMDVYYLREDEQLEVVLSLIDTLNNDNLVYGIMVQLPLPGELASAKNEIIDAIDPKKDVDGLRADSPFVHPTAMAVLQIIEEAQKLIIQDKILKTICVVGQEGMVGTSLVKEIKKSFFEPISESKSADILVSATGSVGIIKAEMVKEGAVVVDVGSPQGDVDFDNVYKKTAFITPVPGGVGPITISCLLENLILASGKLI